MKTIVIGLDAADWGLIDPWIEQGKLPFLAEIIRGGNSFVNRSTVPSLSVPAIPGFYTGKNPGKIGLFGFRDLEGNIITSYSIKEKAIWDYLGDGGYRSAVINVTSTYPVKKINGTMITEHSSKKDDVKAVYPSNLRDNIKDFPFGNEWTKEVDWSRPRDALKKEIAVTERRSDIAKKIINEGNHDFSIFWIHGTDRLNHYFNHLNDIMLDYYVYIDGLLKEWFSEFKGYNFIIMSDHGSEASETKFFYVNSWLEKEGYLRMKGRGSIRKFYSDAIAWVFRALPAGMKASLNKILFKEKGKKERYVNSLLGLDQDSTLANADELGIRINKNLEREEYEKIRVEIIKKLLKLEDNGKRVFREAWKKEDIYEGPYVEHLPDIILVNDQDYFSTPLPSRAIFGKKKRFVKNKVERTGGHNSARNGIFLAYGPDFKKSGERGKMSILDIAPTILHMYGLPVPRDMDGRVLKEIIRPGSNIRKKKVSYKRKAETSKRQEEKVSKEDMEKIKSTLRDLGYIE